MHQVSVSGVQLAQYQWSPEGHPRAAISMFHGFAEYAGRYEHVIAALNKVGVGVIALDFFGHGESEGRKGDVPAYEAGLDWVEAGLQQSKAAFPNVPLFLFGHSMGGNFVANYVLRRKPEIAGVILSSPWLQVKKQPSFFQNLMANIGIRLMPGMTQPTNLDPSVISRVPEEVSRYANDPKIFDAMSARLFKGVVEAGEWAQSQVDQWHLPTYIYHGDGDQLISFEASQRFAQHIPHGQATFKNWEGSYHETHNDEDQDQVIHELVQWVVKHSV